MNKYYDDTEDNMSYRTKIKGLIIYKYGNLLNFSKEQGIPYHSMKRICNGDRRITIEDANMLCKALSKTPKEAARLFVSIFFDNECSKIVN